MREHFFDTETSAMLNFKLPAGHPQQPAVLIEYGYILCDRGEIVEEKSFYVRPNREWIMDPGAQNAHGITYEKVMDEGVDHSVFVDTYMANVRGSDISIAHNKAFDLKMVAHELCLVEKAIYPKETFCTMLNSTGICRIPGMRGRFKWPKLSEAYEHFFGTTFDNAHSALADVRACMQIYRKLQEMGATELEGAVE